MFLKLKWLSEVLAVASKHSQILLNIPLFLSSFLILIPDDKVVSEVSSWPCLASAAPVYSSLSFPQLEMIQAAAPNSRMINRKLSNMLIIINPTLISVFIDFNCIKQF